MINTENTKGLFFRRTLLTAVLIAGPEIRLYAGVDDVRSVQLSRKVMHIEQQKSKVNGWCRILSEGQNITLKDAHALSKDVIKSMSKGERRDLAVATNLLYERLTGKGSANDDYHLWGWQWQRQALAGLEMSDGKDAADLIRRVYRTPVNSVESLEQLNHIENLMHTVHQKMVDKGEVDKTSFKRSKIKKRLIRKGISLIREDNK